MTSAYRRPVVRLAAIAALAASLALAGCGRKGPLEMPPAAAVEPPPPGSPPGTPPPPPPPRRFALDWLLD